jgi:uncharacterized membrane protein YeaQ/YmgE (transglycosylase-associated protein family)
MSIGMTLVLGIVSAIIGGLIWNAVFPDNDGVAWIGSIVVAVVILFLYERVAGAGRNKATRA